MIDIKSDSDLTFIIDVQNMPSEYDKARKISEGVAEFKSIKKSLGALKCSVGILY